MLRFLTAGESHGPALVTIIEGLPAGVPVDLAAINQDLARRQGGHGRGGRMKIEKDQVRVLSGLRHGLTLGSPVSFLIENRDWVNWQDIMSPTPVPPESEASRRWQNRVVREPRPGHADLVGSLKYGHADARNVLERASARETAMRVAAGSLARQLLAPFGIRVLGHVREIGPVAADAGLLDSLDFEALAVRSEVSPVRCADPAASAAMVQEIDAARDAGDSLGGVIEVIAEGLPPGLGSHVHWDRKLDGALAGALMSIQAMKGVEVGLGFAGARRRGSVVHDPIAWSEERGYYRTSNRMGGTEGGMSTGMPLVVRVAQKPIATLYTPLPTVEMGTHRPVEAKVERSDTCAVAAGAVICEAVVAWVVAQFMVDKFGGDSLAEMQQSHAAYLASLQDR